MCEAMQDPAQAAVESQRKQFHRLMLSLETCEAAFTAAQQRHMAVWKLYIFLRQQLFTDDSFIFTKVCRNMRELVDALPAVTSDEQAACEHIKVRVTS
jgi:hypothetical protein